MCGIMLINISKYHFAQIYVSVCFGPMLCVDDFKSDHMILNVRAIL